MSCLLCSYFSLIFSRITYPRFNLRNCLVCKQHSSCFLSVSLNQPMVDSNHIAISIVLVLHQHRTPTHC